MNDSSHPENGEQASAAFALSDLVEVEELNQNFSRASMIT